MPDRLPFEYIDGCTGPAMDTDIVPEGLPICDEPTFETPDVYVARVEMPDVQPPPCVVSGTDPGASDPNAYYRGQWGCRPEDGWDRACSTTSVVVSWDEPTGPTGAVGNVIVLNTADSPYTLPWEDGPVTVAVPDDDVARFIIVKYQVVTVDPPTMLFGWHPSYADKISAVITVPQPIPAVPGVRGPGLVRVLARVEYDATGCMQVQQEQHGPILEAFGGGGSTYAGMFKVFTSGLGTPSIIIDDGRNRDNANCGIVLVSSEAVEVPFKSVGIPEAFIAAEPDDGYLVLYYHVKNPETIPEIALGKEDAAENTPFEIISLADFLAAMPNVDCGRTLIARVSASLVVGSDPATYSITITQEHHGAVYGIIYGPCPEA